MAFVQIIRFKTDRLDEIRALGSDYESATEGRRSVGRNTITKEREPRTATS